MKEDGLVVEIRVQQGDLARRFNAMREWLDREKVTPSHFREKFTDDGILVVVVGFSQRDAQNAAAFRKHFDAAG